MFTGLVQDCDIFITQAMEIPQSCTKLPDMSNQLMHWDIPFQNTMNVMALKAKLWMFTGLVQDCDIFFAQAM